MDYKASNRTWFDTAIALVITLLLGSIAWFALKELGSAKPPGASDEQADALSTPTPLSNGEVITDPLPKMVVKRYLTPGEALVYECSQSGQRTLSDKPCGPDAEGRIVDSRELNTYRQVPITPEDASRQRERVTVGSTSQAAIPQSSLTRKHTLCESIQDEIDRINARMRQPYTSWEGERLRRQWHRAKEHYYDENCGKLEMPAP